MNVEKRHSEGGTRKRKKRCLCGNNSYNELEMDETHRDDKDESQEADRRTAADYDEITDHTGAYIRTGLFFNIG